jgi:hypothetical protein
MKQRLTILFAFLILISVTFCNFNSTPDKTPLKEKTVDREKTDTKNNDSKGHYRIGAECCDGSRSGATGRGACSHHGGVCRWLYSDDPK